MAANKTFTELTELVTVDKNNDWMAVVDVSDTSASIYGTTKKANVDQFIGDKGEAATVDVGTTTTLSAGSDATVSNSGSTSAAVLDFGIPRGPQGVQGIQGVAGADGADGDSAYVYIAYASDASGTGFTTTFNAALDYIAVKATTTEITTPQASDFTGLWKNYKGATGAQGIQGEIGLTGAAGADGVNAYVYIAYASDNSGTGFTTTFDANLDYVAIKTTTTEIVTPQASDFTGLWKNYKGATGATGPAGANGVDGEDGLDINWRGNYASGTAYVINDAVFYSGSSYICKLASTGNLPTDTTYWDLMAQQGAAGAGSGDVSGPASATDNAIARFDLATGKLIQDSLVTVSDDGDVNIPAGRSYLVNGSPVSGYSDEQAQDAIGSILTDSSEVDFTYDGATPSITATLKSGSIDEAKLDTSVNASLDLADNSIQKTTNITALNETGIADGEIAVFNLTNKDIRTSDKTIVTTIGADDTTVPTSKAVNDAIAGFTSYTDEQAQDAVGTILTDSSEIDFTYTDATPSITAAIKAGSIDETKLDVSTNASLDLADSALQNGDTFDELVDGTTNKAYTATEKTKLLGIAENANNYTHPNHSGDVTSVGDGATTIANSAVTNAKMANMATKTYKGRTSSGTGVPEDVAVATLKTDLGLVKADVGLGNVDNTSDATKNSAAVTLTNKTIDGDNNTISNLAHGAEVDNPTSGVHGVTGSVVGTTDTQTLSAKTLTSPVLNTGVSGTAVLDEDDMASNSATKLATQQSIKAYVDSKDFTWEGAWATSTPYSVNDTVENDGSGYVCTSAHTSGATTEPGVGASWTDKWDLFVEGTDKTMPTGDIVGTTDTQTLTNKTIDGDNNTLSDISPSSIKGGLDGWIPAGETWTYASADDPTFTFTVASDVTTKYSAGMKIKLTQGTVKYFIITAVSTYSGGNTTITVYGGTDYDLANSAISANAYSMMKSPQGFPMSPAKWTVSVTDTSSRTQTTPTSGTWYNIGSISISIPIGAWKVTYKVFALCGATGASDLGLQTALSTANNSSSDTGFHCQAYTGNLQYLGVTMSKNKDLTITSKTTYYLNTKGVNAGLNLLRNDNDQSPLFITATCAYL